MESAKEFAERYFVETSGACESLTNDIQARDAAIRAEDADRAVKCFFTTMAESGLSTSNDYAVAELIFSQEAQKMIEKDGVIPNVLKKLLEKLKAALTDQNPDLHEDHAKTRYAQMAREVCEKEASHDTD